MKCPSPSRRTIPLSPAAAAVSAVPLLPSYLARSLYAEPLREHLSPTSWLFIQPPRPQSPLFLAPSRLGVFALSGSSASGCKLHQSSRHAPSCRPPRCAQPQPRRVVCAQKGKSPLSVAAATSCRWSRRQRKAAKPPGRKEAGRKLVPCRVEHGRSHVAQCIDRFCKLNTYYRPDRKIPLKSLNQTPISLSTPTMSAPNHPYQKSVFRTLLRWTTLQFHCLCRQIGTNPKKTTMRIMKPS